MGIPEHSRQPLRKRGFCITHSQFVLGKPDIALGRRKVYREIMSAFTAVIEKCPQTGLFVGFVPGFPGAHSQGDTLDELHSNLREVITMLIEDGEPPLEAEYIGTQLVTV